MRREATVAARQRILAVGFNPRMGTMRTNTSRSDRSTQFPWHGDLNLEAFLPCQSVTHVLNQKCNLCSDPYPVPGYRSSFIRYQTSPLCGYQLRFLRSSKELSPRPNKAVEDGSGTAAVTSKCLSRRPDQLVLPVVVEKKPTDWMSLRSGAPPPPETPKLLNEDHVSVGAKG